MNSTNYNKGQRLYVYTDGNAARKLNSAAPRQAPRQRTKEQVRKQRQKRHHVNKKMLPINGKYAFFLAAASVACLVVCVAYLNVQSGIKAKAASIHSLRTQVEDLKTQNDSLDYSINGHVDVDAICKKAEKKLGMVQAGKDQISKYDKTDSEFMKQTEDIPEK